MKRKENIVSDKHKCSCGKTYTYKQGLYVHRKKSNCKEKENENKLNVQIDNLQVETDKLKCSYQSQTQELVRIEKELERLKKENERLKLKIQKQEKQENRKVSPSSISDKRQYQKRLKLTNKEREQIAETQQSQCKLCESALPEYYHIDHIVALQFGGSNEMDNLQAICAGCHNTKTVLETKNAKKIKEAIYAILYPTSM